MKPHHSEFDDTLVAPQGRVPVAEAKRLNDGSTPTGAPNIGVVNDRARPRFSAETEALLRTRLKAAAIDLIVVLGLGLIGNSLVGNYNWLGLRLFIFASVIGSYLLLRRSAVLQRSALRFIEGILFGGVAIQIALMMYSGVYGFAKAGDAVSMHSAADFFAAAFCLHILTYGIFMPNSWKRAAVVMSTFALIPYVIWFGLIKWDPEVARLAEQNHSVWPIPIPFVAAIIGTFGSHMIHRTRREAFQARQFLQYRLKNQIGSGGMGDVYLAEHVLLKRPCAIKLIKPEHAGDQKTLKLFEREVIATASLSHWNTIDIYDYGHTADGTFYYVMELLSGLSLQELVQRTGPVPPARLIALLTQVCDALQEAHQAGLIHRDIKPANIFVTRRGGVWDVAKLLDFGLVREVKEGEKPKQTGFSGTPSFMAPEQALDYHSVDARTDLYALGAVAYFLLTGAPPFTADNLASLLYAHACLQPEPLAKRGTVIDKDLEAIVLRCLEKEPSERFQSAKLLGEALQRCESANRWNQDMAGQWWKTLQHKESLVIDNGKSSVFAGATEIKNQGLRR